MSTGRDLDFTSSLYLGMYHPTPRLPSWSSLTTGVPAALREPPVARAIGTAVARLQGAESGMVGRSVLHALTDVMGVLPRPGDVVMIDAATYPIAKWATLLAKVRGATVLVYPHHRPDYPQLQAGRRLLLVTDGWCHGCGRPAPLPRLQRMACDTVGLVVVDDSQAFGVLGRRHAGDPFGDGSGTPRWSGVDHSHVLWVASMAKAYGAPLAVITGDRATVDRLAREGDNRLHSSPPSAADLGAGAAALSACASTRARRARLCTHVLALRRSLRQEGLSLNGLPFPVVGVRFVDSGGALQWWSALRDMRIHTVVQRTCGQSGALLSAVLRADHSADDIERLIGAIRRLGRRREAA